MELKKIIRSKFCIFCTIAVAVCVLLGYFLLASLDKILSPSITELYNSIYTVYTEFGMLIFPVLVIYTFHNDYKNKNILFYKLMGYDWLQYFLKRLFINFCCMSIPTILGLFLVGVVYNDFSYLGIMVIYFECVLAFQVILQSMWGFIFKSMMVGYMVNFVYWLLSIASATANKKVSFLARYDAANSVYARLNKYLKTRDAVYLDIKQNLIYTVGVFIVVVVIVWINRKRWEKNGI